MSEEQLQQLGWVLKNIDQMTWSDDLYLPPRPWTMDVPCAVLDSEYEEDEVPEKAARSGLAYVLTIQDTRGIVGNLTQRVPQPTDSQFLAAFEYYVDHDAFIDDDALGEAKMPVDQQ